MRQDSDMSPFATTGTMLEPGDVTQRHETTNWFDDEAYEEEKEGGEGCSGEGGVQQVVRDHGTT